MYVDKIEQSLIAQPYFMIRPTSMKIVGDMFLKVSKGMRPGRSVETNRMISVPFELELVEFRILTPGITLPESLKRNVA